ncbi:SWIM zinc finger family protein [Actinophytocola sp. KF-1]
MRADLLALTADALAGLANRGLVKRATKELDTVPPVVAAADGTVEATFADGATVTLPPGHGLDTANCTCGAPGICRHRIGAVLAYQRDHSSAPPVATVPAGWPGSVTDEELTAQFGARTVTAARRMISAGLTARVRRHAMTVETPSATVRFLVPGELGFVDCDARAEARDALVVVAVWAFRHADATQPDVTVDLSGHPDRPVPAAMAGVATTAGELLRTGVVAADEVLVAALRRELAACERANLRWPAAALAELVDQLSAYGTRSAQHDPVRVAELIAELHARHHAAARAPSRVLGADEPAETPLRQVRLVALGCRVGRDDAEDAATAEVFLAHPGTETVLAVRHRWAGHAGAMASRRLAGTTLASLAAGNVVSEAAVRSAGRVVRFGAGRLARTTVSPLGESWTELPAALRPSVTEALAQLTGLPPRVVRPRVAAELVRVLPVAAVRQVRYHAGAQRLDAVVADHDGAVATVSLAHRPAAPGALDALANALSAGPLEVSGTIRRARGGLVVEPYAVRTEAGVVVPDLAAASGAVPPATQQAERDPLAAAIADALALLAEAAHRGLTRLPPTITTRAAPVAAALTRVGLTRCGEAVSAWATAPADPGTWLRAEIRLLTADELH